jgi:hypothetical protein
MNLFGFTDFSKETRTKFRDCIYDRMDTVYSNWLYGEYDSATCIADLECVLDDDPEVNEMCVMYGILYRTFKPHRTFTNVSKFDWLAERAGLDSFPTRETNYYYTPGLIREWGDCSDTHRIFSMHGPDGEVQRVRVARPVADRIARPVVDTPRRSTRVKYPRDFYYGY